MGSINMRSTNYDNMNFNSVHTVFTNNVHFASGSRGNMGGSYNNLHGTSSISGGLLTLLGFDLCC